MTATRPTAASRDTRQKSLIRKQLAAADEFVGAQELHLRLLQQGHRIGLGTVYQNLREWAARGEIDTLEAAGAQQMFRLCRSEGAEHAQHHFLVCDECWSSVALPVATAESLERAAARHGFEVRRRVVEVYGRCGRCSTRRPSD